MGDQNMVRPNRGKQEAVWSRLLACIAKSVVTQPTCTLAGSLPQQVLFWICSMFLGVIQPSSSPLSSSLLSWPSGSFVSSRRGSAFCEGQNNWAGSLSSPPSQGILWVPVMQPQGKVGTGSLTNRPSRSSSMLGRGFLQNRKEENSVSASPTGSAGSVSGSKGILSFPGHFVSGLKVKKQMNLS